MPIQTSKSSERHQLRASFQSALTACLLVANFGILPGVAMAQLNAQPPVTIPIVPAPMNPSNMPPSGAATALKIQSDTQKVPAGTMLTLSFNTTLDSRTTNLGDIFTANLAQDFTVRSKNNTRRVILPAGTTIRGRVSDVKRPTFFSHGGTIYLAFDHVVLPSGELLPITLNLSTENTIVNKQGGLYTDPGIGKKVQKGVEQGKTTFENITEHGVSAGKQIAGGLGTIVTVPAAVVGGALAGTAVTTGKAAVAVVGKGESAVIKPGDTLNIDFGGSFNLPAE